ncbi:MAG TPA: pilus assembly protein PilM [Deltaproteobacteria bacterium]|nr:pilus assembly protein PilM [Deltaproteobacteria bacterium]
MLFQTSLGIDFQDTSVSVALLKTSINDVKLASYGTFPLSGESTAAEKFDQAAGFIGAFLKKAKISPACVFLSLPRNVVIIRYVDLPVALKENLQGSLRYEMEKFIPLPENEIFYDYQIISEEKETGKLRIFLAIIKRTTLDPYLTLLNRLNLRVSGIEFCSTAISNYFSDQKKTGKSTGMAVVSTGDGFVQLDFLKSGFLQYSRWFNRCENESDLSDRLSQEIRKLAEEHHGEGNGRLETMFLGDVSQEKLLEHLKEMDEIELHMVDLSKNKIPSFNLIPAYALALKGIRDVPTDINLMPAALRKKPNKAGQYVMLALAMLLILSAMAWGGGDIFSKRVYLGKLNETISQLETQVATIEKSRKGIKDVENQIDYLNALYSKSMSALDILKDLSERVPKTAWLRKFSFSEKGVTIDGWADSSSELIPALESSPLFKDVSFLSSITRDRSGKEIFRIGFKLN